MDIAKLFSKQLNSWTKHETEWQIAFCKSSEEADVLPSEGMDVIGGKEKCHPGFTENLVVDMGIVRWEGFQWAESKQSSKKEHREHVLWNTFL